MHFVGDEVFEQRAEQVVLAKQLVDGGSLGEPQLAKLGGLRHHRGIRRDRLGARRTHEAGDFGNELRNVIEQLLAGKDLPFLDDQQRIEFVEPSSREIAAGSRQTSRQRLGGGFGKGRGTHELLGIGIPIITAFRLKVGLPPEAPKERRLVGMPGFEPGTSCTPSRRATRLRYIPILQTSDLLLDLRTSLLTCSTASFGSRRGH